MYVHMCVFFVGVRVKPLDESEMVHVDTSLLQKKLGNRPTQVPHFSLSFFLLRLFPLFHIAFSLLLLPPPLPLLPSHLQQDLIMKNIIKHGEKPSNANIAKLKKALAKRPSIIELQQKNIITDLNLNKGEAPQFACPLFPPFIFILSISASFCVSIVCLSCILYMLVSVFMYLCSF